jgi:hypothetical protein
MYREVDMETYEYKIGMRSGDSGADGTVLVSCDAGKEQTVALFRGYLESLNTEEYDSVVLGAAASDKALHLTFIRKGDGNDICHGYSWFWEK